MLAIAAVIIIVPDDPAVIDVLTVMSYSAPGCRPEILTLFCVHGTVTILPNSPTIWEPIMMLALYVTV